MQETTQIIGSEICAGPVGQARQIRPRSGKQKNRQRDASPEGSEPCIRYSDHEIADLFIKREGPIPHDVTLLFTVIPAKRV
jgi:hypothetical protein